jgi:hypothetical protein
MHKGSLPGPRSQARACLQEAFASANSPRNPLFLKNLLLTPFDPRFCQKIGRSAHRKPLKTGNLRNRCKKKWVCTLQRTRAIRDQDHLPRRIIQCTYAAQGLLDVVHAIRPARRFSAALLVGRGRDRAAVLPLVVDRLSQRLVLLSSLGRKSGCSRCRSCWSARLKIQRFDPISKISKLPDHLGCSHAFRPFG